MKKRYYTYIIAFLLAAAMAFGVSGCSLLEKWGIVGDSGSLSESESSQSSDKEQSVQAAQVDFELLQLTEVTDKDILMVIKTNMGDITVRLFPEEAPLAVENFLKLAEKGYYDGVIFHNVIADFLIQSGDPTGTGSGGNSIYTNEKGESVTFADEFSSNLPHLCGALAMANDGTANSNGSQFFIVAQSKLTDDAVKQLIDRGYPQKLVEAYRQYGGIPQYDYKYTVFGSVYKGMDTVIKISRVATDSASSGRPVEDVVIESIELVAKE